MIYEISDITKHHYVIELGNVQIIIDVFEIYNSSALELGNL